MMAPPKRQEGGDGRLLRDERHGLAGKLRTAPQWAYLRAVEGS